MKTLIVERDAVLPVAILRLNRPEVRNAFNEVLIAELTDAIKKLEKDSTVRAVVLRGEGPTFCAGGDMNWLRKAIDFTPKQNLKDTLTLAQLFERMNEFPKPIIGLVHGAAIGGGVGLVSICDIVIASQETVFSLSEVRLGVVPACIGPFVISKIGATHARRYFMSGERFDARAAQSIGLVHEVVGDPSELNHALEQILQNIILCGPKAMASAKKLVLDLSWPERRNKKKDPVRYVSKMLADLRVTPEAQEGLKAFLEKRKPSWLNQKGSPSR